MRYGTKRCKMLSKPVMTRKSFAAWKNSWRHKIGQFEYLIIEGDEALKLSRSEGIVWPVGKAKIEERKDCDGIRKAPRP